MPRRTRSSILEDLSHLPWWVSASIAVLSFITLKYILPEIAMQSMFGKGLQTILPNIAWLVALVFAIPAVISLLRSLNNRPNNMTRAHPKSQTYKNPKPSKPSHRKEVISMLMEELPPSSAVAASRPPIEKPTEWSSSLLNQLEWKRFEEVCRAYFEIKGFESKATCVGADGGVDINLYKGNLDKPAVLVQCKAWSARKVDVRPVRELFGVMAAEDVSQGVLMATGEFTDEAKEFAKGKKLILSSGTSLLKAIKNMPEDSQKNLLLTATEGDYTTPTCVSCDIKMKLRTSKKGKNVGSKFWGCRNYPRCKKRLKLAV